MQLNREFFSKGCGRKVCADKIQRLPVWGGYLPYFHDFVAGYGNPAKHTQRLIGSEDLIVVGAAGMYEAGAAAASNPT